ARNETHPVLCTASRSAGDYFSPPAHHATISFLVPAHVADPGADLRHPGDEPRHHSRLYGSRFARPRRLLRPRRLQRRNPGPPFGQTLLGIRESESRMRTLGYHVWLHKYIGFVIAGGVGGFAGVLWAYYNGFVSPVDLQLATSVEVLLMVALGGRGTLLGPALGAGIIVFLKNLVSVYTHRWLLILGAVYIATIVYAPEGLL